MVRRCECGAGDVDERGNFVSRNPELEDNRQYVHVALSYAQENMETCGASGGNVKIVGWEKMVSEECMS